MVLPTLKAVHLIEAFILPDQIFEKLIIFSWTVTEGQSVRPRENRHLPVILYRQNWLHAFTMTSSNGNIFRVTGPFYEGNPRSPVDSHHKGQWSGAWMFPLICSWRNGWANNRDAGDLRRHRPQCNEHTLEYPRFVMSSFIWLPRLCCCCVEWWVSSLAPGRFEFNVGLVIFKRNLLIYDWGVYLVKLTSSELDLTDDKSTLAQVMA